MATRGFLFLCTTDRSIQHILQPDKQLKRRTLQKTIRQLGNCRSSRATENVELRRQHPTPTFRPMPAFQQTVKHERRNVVYRFRAAEWPQYRRSFTGCRHSKEGYFSWLTLVLLNILGSIFLKKPSSIFPFLFSLPPRRNSDPGSNSRLFSSSLLRFAPCNLSRKYFALFLPSSTCVDV